MFLIQSSPSAPPEIKTLAEQADEEVRRIGTLAHSTLGFFRQDQRRENVDLCASAESVNFLLRPLLRQRGIELVIEHTGDCTVNANSMDTRQVLLNLVRNACEATTLRGSQVKIHIQGRTDDVSITVEDQGAGIAPDVLRNLFQFGVSTKGERGNGIGLWVVRKMVTRHGGSVHVQSTVGKGTSFNVSWPRQLAPEHVSMQNLVATAPTG
jgi:signal transduction histidine kinase